MTCMQPACRYQFCWDCGGDYHTSTQCSRPKVVPQAGSVLAFDELDKQCANHFLARQVAAKGYSACLAELERSQRPEEATLLKIKAEGWQVLSDAQSALAHTCIVMYYVKSAKLEFNFNAQKQITCKLQQCFEEEWQHLNSPTEIKRIATAVRDLRMRLREYLLMANTEIVQRSPTVSSAPGSLTKRRESEGRSPRSSLRNSKSLSSSHPVDHLLAELKDYGKSPLSTTVFGL